MTNEKIFKEAVNFYINFFGLYDNEIETKINDIDDSKAITETERLNTDDSARIFSITYDTESLKNSSRDEIFKTVFHEILEIMIFTLRNYSINNDIFVSEREVDDAIHRIIKRFENKVFPLIKSA